jgi:signal transduction histidine kinase
MPRRRPIDDCELESLAHRRLPTAIALPLAFLAGAVAVELSSDPTHGARDLVVLAIGALPLPYLCIALGSVVLLAAVAASSTAHFRREAKARERCLRDARDELQDALARAEDAVRVRSRLVANVSHEVRTPVHVILGYADMLLDASTDAATARQLIGRVREKAVQLEELIAQLLDLSRLSCGRLERRVVDLDVPGLLEDAADGARRSIGRRPVRVRTECRVARLCSDPGRVRQILNNLATNAAKFTARGEIRLAAWPTPSGVAIEVRDTGCGIAPEHHEAVFAAFEQVAPSAPENGGAEGIGLGLAIVKQLCDLLEGSVEVVSTPGRGATFTVLLPHLAAPSPVRPSVRETPAALDERATA